MEAEMKIRNGDGDKSAITTAMSLPAKAESTSPMLLRELMKPKRQASDQPMSPTTTVADCSVSMFSLKNSGINYITGGFRRPPKTTSDSSHSKTILRKTLDSNRNQQVRGLHCATTKIMNEMNEPGMMAPNCTSTDRFLCGICKFQFSDLRDFLVHKSSHKNVAGKTVEIRCELCETFFASQTNLLTHYKVDHAMQLPPIPVKLETAYQEDGDRVTAEPIIVISEDEDAEDKAAQTKSPTKCHTRTKRTKKKRGMHWTRRKLHIKQQKVERTLQELHDNEGDPMAEPEDGCYPCPVCGMVFDRLVYLDKHTSLHNGLQKIVFGGVGGGGNGSIRDLPMDLVSDPSLASQRLRKFAESAKKNGGSMPADCYKSNEGEFFDPLGVCQVLLDVAEDPEDVPYVAV